MKTLKLMNNRLGYSMSRAFPWLGRYLDQRRAGSVLHQGDPLESIHTNIKYWCIMAGMSRTNIEINDQLAREAQKLTGLKTKRAVVNGALELLVRTERRKGLLLLRQRRLEG